MSSTRDALRDAVDAARPEVVIHQLTDLPQVFDPSELAASAARAMPGCASRARRNLVAAARGRGRPAGLIAQSIAFVYRRGPEPHAESDPLAAADGDDLNALTVARRRAHRRRDAQYARHRRHRAALWPALRPRHLDRGAQGREPPLHVDAAAQAALLAVTRGAPGIYNIAEDDGAVTIDKARKELGFDPAFQA